MSLSARTLGLAARLWDALPLPLRRRVLFASNDRFLVGVVGLISDPEGRVLLLEHRFRTPHRWGLPGGFIGRGETLVDALARELHEELGLKVLPSSEPFDTELNVSAGYLSVTLCASLPVAPPLDYKSPEILGGGFFGPEAFPEGLYPYHRALVEQFWRSHGLRE